MIRVSVPRAAASLFRLAAGLSALLMAVLGTALVVGGSREQLPDLTARTAALQITYAPEPPAYPATSAGKKTNSNPRLARSVPVRLNIPRIGVDTSLIELGLKPDGTVEVPGLGASAPAGWYRNLASPGEIGPAVLIGHVDSAAEGPAVFFRLSELLPGDRIFVQRADGLVASFLVKAVNQYPKSNFPTDQVYGDLTYAGLRLVTCGGNFDSTQHSYLDSTVVYAEFTGVK